MEEVGCPFCGARPGEVAFEEDGWTGLRCAPCGVVFVSPRPSPDEVRRIYAHDSAHLSAESHVSRRLGRRLHARHALRAIARHARGGRLLEVGAGAGVFLDEARRRGFDVRGIELNPIQARAIREDLGIPCDESPLDPARADGAPFDVVWHCDVLSHLPDPAEELRRMRAVLAPQGVVAFETGNVADVAPERLALLERAGLRAVEIRRYSVVPDLLARRALTLAARALAGASAAAAAPGPPARPARARAPWWRRIARAVVDSTLHALRYGVGRWAPKAGRPQTLIVIAKPAERGR